MMTVRIVDLKYLISNKLLFNNDLSSSDQLGFMNQTFRNTFLILILTLSVLFMPAVMGAGIIELSEEDDLSEADEDNFSAIRSLPLAWIRIPVHQLSVLLRLGISIFALCVVYLGGRSKHKRFNDRTLDHINAFISYSFKTALFVRAVFYFLFPPFSFNHPNKYFVNPYLPTLILNSRRY